jgi:hypothetical protein
MNDSDLGSFWAGVVVASVFWGIIVAIVVGNFLERRRPAMPRLPGVPPCPSCPVCAEPMERVAAVLVADAERFAERGMPAPDWYCPEPSCHTGDRGVVYCYAVRPGEPVRLSPAKPEPEGDLA